jgi:four helix bundle protein
VSNPESEPPVDELQAPYPALEDLGPAQGFPHEHLDVYRVALQLVAKAQRVAAHIPRGHRSVAEHLLRSAPNVVLLLAEGANRRGTGEKRQRFVESRGECGEVAAAADVLLVMRLCPAPFAQELKGLAGRVSAMLTGLIGRLQ